MSETSTIPANGAAVAYFSASWCGPCRVFKPRVESVANSRDDVDVIFIDVDESQDLVSKYGIKSVPTVIGVRDSEEVSRLVGVRTGEELSKFIDELVG
jgi:thioredoxin